MEAYLGRWTRGIRSEDRKIKMQLRILKDLTEDPSKLQENASLIACASRTIVQSEKEIDRLQRLIDGRPTAEEDRRQSCLEFEARMSAESAREHGGGWADDEFNARYDDMRERYHGEC
tara:strand:+ start:23385 stop:23738 length:354 start_codon:yes stop_codon:yes gene_type:complete